MKLTGNIIALIVFAVAAVIYFLFNPAVSSFFPNCPFNSLTGFYCPGCGSQRAIHQLLHGNIIAAAGYNVLLLLSLPVLMYAMIATVYKTVKGTYGNWDLIYKPWFPKAVLIIVLSFWLLRNLPYYPFNLLAPHN
jgi:hypothetical protein